MNITLKLTVLSISAFLITACSTTKKAATTAVAPQATVPNNNNFMLLKPAVSAPAPGNAELAAMQTKYKDLTMEKLKEGFTTYTQGACTNCHGAKDIYYFGEQEWKNIIDDMAQRAAISDTEKDAVYKYVLAIKATQR